MEKLLDKKTVDMTTGPLFGKLILFILPVIATNLLQVFYNMADMIVVGLSSEENAVGAIGTCSAFVNLFLNLVIGVSVGVNVIVAHGLGAKNPEDIKKTIDTGTLTGLIFGVVFGVAGVFVARPMLIFLGDEGNVLDLATRYSQIFLLGLPFSALTNCAIAIFRAKGDSSTPLVVLGISGIVNVLLNLFFVLICKMSVEGVAIATVMSNMISTVVLYIILNRTNGVCKFTFKKFSFSLNAVKKILIVGVPSAIQSALFSISNMLIQSAVIKVDGLTSPVGAKYQPVLKGNTAAVSLESIPETVASAVYSGATSFTGQNYGARDFKRIRKVLWYCYVITFAFTFFVGAVMYALKTPLFALYGVKNGEIGSLEKIAYDTATVRAGYMFLTYFLCGFMDVGAAVLRGQRKSIMSAVICLVCICVLRVLWILTIFNANPTLENICISYPISWFVSTVILFIFSLVTIKKGEKQYQSKS